MRKVYKTSVGKLEWEIQLERAGVDGRIILKWKLKTMCVSGVWIY
jgi:hypothetical protein